MPKFAAKCANLWHGSHMLCPLQQAVHAQVCCNQRRKLFWSSFVCHHVPVPWRSVEGAYSLLSMFSANFWTFGGCVLSDKVAVLLRSSCASGLPFARSASVVKTSCEAHHRAMGAPAWQHAAFAKQG